ncbi:MAG: Rrf2 family transcriptional regulator [Clostridia bacterium]|nr:Rrf2 family transcriptional regulator [Clostridia bacterium]
MKINMETDYALRIMRCLAEENSITDAKTISEFVEVPLRFTLKILGKLVSGGIIVSQKGANGGYKLSRPADKITLRQVIEIIEGPLVISRCLSQDFVCRHEGNSDKCSCFFNKIFDEINYTIAAKLDSVTIADSINQEKL